MLIKEGLNFLLDILGVNDLIGCFHGGVGACVSLAMNFIPWGKVFKVAKDVFRAINDGMKAFKTWRRIVESAERFLARADDAIAAAEHEFDEAAAALRREEDAAADAVKAGCHSFAPNTRILMADGTTKPISQVKPGDHVKTTDPISGTTKDEVVKEHHINHDTTLTDLVIIAGGHRSTIHTTQNHLFYDDTRHAWVNAADLQPGDHLHTTHRPALITHIHNFTSPRNMQDLTIANIHTYYVIAGNTPVLVHNCGTGETPTTLRHYTNEDGMNGIVNSNELRASTKAANPKDARYGDGQYLSDIQPGTMTASQLSRNFLGHPFSGSRFTHYVDIDVTGLNVIKGRGNVFVVLNDGPLDLVGRIVGWGAN